MGLRACPISEKENFVGERIDERKKSGAEDGSGG